MGGCPNLGLHVFSSLGIVVNLEQPPARRSWLVSIVWWLEAALEVRPMVRGLWGVIVW